MNETHEKKSQFWPCFFTVLFLNLSIWFSMGFILAFNPQVKKAVNWKPFMWFVEHFVLAQWLYLIPLILVIYKCKGINASKGVVVAGLVMVLLLLCFQLH
jgi:uncharacterized membrane protein